MDANKQIENNLRDKSLYWWTNLTAKKMRQLRDKHFPTRQALTADERLEIYNAEHPTTSIADLTGDKVFDTPVSLFLRQENDLLKERIKVLREALEIAHKAIEESDVYMTELEWGIINSAIEQTK